MKKNKKGKKEKKKRGNKRKRNTTVWPTTHSPRTSTHPQRDDIVLIRTVLILLGENEGCIAVVCDTSFPRLSHCRVFPFSVP